MFWTKLGFGLPSFNSEFLNIEYDLALRNESSLFHSIVYGKNKYLKDVCSAIEYLDNLPDWILKEVQNHLNHLLNLKDSSPSSLYNLICVAPLITSVIARAAPYKILIFSD